MAENYFGITDVGRVREKNEDTFIAEKLSNKNVVLACVIDGVGGYVGGEVAASLAREVILEHCKSSVAQSIDMLKDALIAANEKIYLEKLQNQEYNKMACVATLALADVQHNKFYYAHVGDTRLYLLRDETLVKVSKDQSFVGFLEDTGRLTERAAMTHPRRNEIDKALGFDAHLIATNDYIETGESPFLPGDILLLCSDGLTDMVTREQIMTALSNHKTLPEKGKALVQAANDAGGNDNITVVLAHNNKRGVKQKAIQPASLIKKNEQSIDEPVIKEAPLPVVQPLQTISPAPPTVVKSNKGIIILLSSLCLVFFGCFLWMLWKSKTTGEAPQATLAKQMNLQEKRLANAIGYLRGNTLVLSDSFFAQEIIISDTLFINHDSLHLKGGSNTVLVRDSLYEGPAFMLSKDCKYVLLENLTLSYFDIGIIAQNKALHLKNVQFNNCHIPLQYQFTFPDKQPISGSITDQGFFNLE
ncbi:protein phosphatase 2C domain-containing protein [Chitinophagaceae bacterium LB-8]|uniref:Protein phosphatase 2C domain-containing protein n=1 Tax=Paraflavisolibacter caeni TaxID=2982496 RepID=A0A9X3BA11_9BACT|nr:protein phosphatase 2C domain-containing protein [Paraflavisolibacter caeni]MCU7552036.1 protein phosphatase 2C domain-containing protein [Paraflavisolibacter caeni]